MKKRLITGLSLVLPIALCIISCNGNPVATDTIQNSPDINTAIVRKVSEPQERTYTFISKPYKESNLSFRIGGPVIEFDSNPGQFYRKGEIIARIDDRDYILKKEHAEAVMTHSEKEFRRIEKLYGKNNVSPSTYEKARSEYIQAKTLYETAVNDLEDTRLRAPFDGYVQKVFIDEFQDVRPSEPVISFIDISRIKAEACIPEETASMLRRAGTDKVKVCFETIGGKTFTPDKIYITQGSSQNNISFILTAVIPNPKSVLSGGMSGKISISASGNGEESPLAIPQKALCHDAQNNDFVWVINKDGNPELRKVTAGDLVKGGNIIVVSGLKEGEEIVTEGKYRLPDNSRQH